MTRRESLIRDIEIAKDQLYRIKSREQYPAAKAWLETCRGRLVEHDKGIA